MLDLLDLSIGKGKREPTADEKLAALSRDTRRRKKILQDAWAESQRVDTVKHAKIHGLVGYEMLRRKDEQKRDVEARRGVLGIRRPRRHRRALSRYAAAMALSNAHRRDRTPSTRRQQRTRAPHVVARGSTGHEDALRFMCRH